MQAYSYYFFLFLSFLFQNLNLSAQHFGGNPASIKWLQLDNDTIRVIFPEGMEKQAFRINENILWMSRKHRESIGFKTKKLNIVLQNQTVISNAYVGLPPYRSEFFASPPHDSRTNGSLNWIDQLSIHEYRHALQFINARYGFTKLAYYLSGESGWALMMNLSIPDWYFEGDAVLTETELSKQGRGRVPAFFNNSRALGLQNIHYKYAKIRNASLKDRVPNHYESGFILTNYGREKYGISFWKDVLKDAASYRSIFYPFSRAIKRRTSLNSKEFYDSAYTHFEKKWENFLDTEYAKGSVLFKIDEKTVSNYSYPRIKNDSVFYFLKSSYKEIPKVYKSMKGVTKALFSPGIALDHYYSIHDDKIVWAALSFDERWGWQQFSDIFVYNQKTGKKKRISRKQKYFSPYFSLDGTELLVFENTSDQNYSLKILDLETGELKEKIPNPQNFYFSYPKFSEKDTMILTIARNKTGENALLRINRKSGEYEVLLDFSHQLINRFCESDKGIYFVAGYTGVDNIYLLDKNLQLFKISNSNYGILDLAVSKSADKLLFTEYSLNGNLLKELDPDSIKTQKFIIPELEDSQIFNYSFLDESQKKLAISRSIKTYEIKKYPLFSHLINLHSWIPILEDPFYGIRLQSENILNTLRLEGGYEYNRNEAAGGYFLKGQFSQYYPIINFGLEHTARSAKFADSSSLKWTENRYSIGYTLPFNFSGGLYYRSFSFSNTYQNHYINDTEKAWGSASTIQTLNFRSNFRIQKITALQHLFTHLGAYSDIVYETSFVTAISNQLNAEFAFAFRGFSPKHNFIVEASLQKRDKEEVYQFSDRFSYSRGFESVAHDQIYKLSANYHLTLFYPDWGFAGINYIYRNRLNLFFDYSRGSTNQSYREYNSTGIEFIFDSRIFNALNLSYGIRYSHILNSENSSLTGGDAVIELFIPFNNF